MKYLFIVFSLILAACGKPVVGPAGPQGIPGPQGSPGAAGLPAPKPSSTPSPVVSPAVSPSPDPYATEEQFVTQYNQYREALGQDDIMPGLTCTLYTIPNTTTQIIGATLTNKGSFLFSGTFNVPNQATSVGLSILPTLLQPDYQNWFIVKCTGYIVIGKSGWYAFDTISDDGSNLYVDGSLVVNNDGLHSITDVQGVKFLQANVHSFELDYLQGTGMEALILNLNGNLLPSQLFYH